MEVTPVDLLHLELPGAICAYLVETPDGPALVDPGPSTTLDRLREGLAAAGMPLEALRHVLLTHVHLDHAGATGHLVRANPRLLVHVHEEGAPHMADPGRLVASTRRTFGEAHDRLWGDVLPVPASALEGWRPGDGAPVAGVRPLSTPGHIGHHLSWLDDRDGMLFAGDALGIVLGPEAPTHPPTPPPTVDLPAWRQTLELIRSVGPERAGVTHFGVHGDVSRRADELEEALDALEARVEAALDDEDAGEAYDREVRDRLSAHLPGDRVERYFDTFSASKDWAGMRRYVTKRIQEEG